MENRRKECMIFECQSVLKLSASASVCELNYHCLYCDRVVLMKQGNCAKSTKILDLLAVAEVPCGGFR